MIKATMIGDKEFIKKLKNVPENVRKAVEVTVQKLGFELQARVQRDKLSGQVLKAPTGRLRASINPQNALKSSDSRSRFEPNGNQIYYYVGTNVEYAAAWEHGSAARDIFPVKGKALKFTVAGKTIFSKKVHIPAQAARPFLAPTLREMRSFILEQIEKAAAKAMQESLKK